MAFQAGGDGKQAREALLVAGLVLQQGCAAALGTTVGHLRCGGPGGKEVVENRVESPRPSGRRGSLYVPRVSGVLVLMSHTSCIIHGLKL